MVFHYVAGQKESTKGYLFHVRLILLQRLCQLIRAGSWAEAALDAFDAGDCLVNIHAIDQAATPCVLPEQPPTNCTFFTLLSSTSKLISREQTPFVLYVMVKPPQNGMCFNLLWRESTAVK